MTNLEWIKSLSTEEMAEFLVWGIDCNDICTEAESGCIYNCKYNIGKQKFIEWLNSEKECTKGI